MTTILVIDDETPLLEEVELILRFAGYDVLGTPDPQIGIEMANQQNPDLILCDVMMPYVNGYSVLQRLRDNPATTHIPFIFLTARTTRQDLRQGMELGADDYITKPFSHTELLSAVAVRLEKQQKVRSAQLRQLSYDLVEAQTAERHHIARELQEKVGQVLQSAGLILHSSLQRSDSFVNERLEEIHKLIDNAASQVLELSMDLHPLLLDHLGLVPTLNWFLERHNQRSSNHAALVDVWLAPESPLVPEIQKVTYWIIREALGMLAPRLGLQNLQIDLNSNHLRLEIRVTGTCEKRVTDAEAYLLRLYEYTFAFGGSLNFDFPSNSSAVLRISLPVSPDAQATLPLLDVIPTQTFPQADGYENAIDVMVVSSHAGTRDALFKLLSDADDISIRAMYQHIDDLCVEEDVVVLLDLSGEHTLETISTLVQDNPMMPLLVIGNDSEENTALEVMRRKATGYILRNAGRDALLEAIHLVCNGRRYLSSPFREQAIEFYVHTRRSVDDSQKFQQLTRREREVLDWVIAGYTSAEIAQRLSLSPRTVETHRNNLMRKLNVHSKWELIGYVNAGR